jgi:hypothetical protein
MGKFVEDLDESTYNQFTDYCTRKGYYQSSQATNSPTSSPPVESDGHSEDGEVSGVVEDGESESDTTTPVHRYHPPHELSVLASSNPVLMSESDLPNKHIRKLQST